MPKMKTDSGAKKRFKITGTGKLMRRRAYRAHILRKKPSTRTRRLAGDVVVNPADEKAMRRLLGVGKK